MGQGDSARSRVNGLRIAKDACPRLFFDKREMFEHKAVCPQRARMVYICNDARQSLIFAVTACKVNCFGRTHAYGEKTGLTAELRGL